MTNSLDGLTVNISRPASREGKNAQNTTMLTSCMPDTSGGASFLEVQSFDEGHDGRDFRQDACFGLEYLSRDFHVVCSPERDFM